MPCLGFEYGEETQGPCGKRDVFCRAPDVAKKWRAVNPTCYALNVRVKDLLKRWDREDKAAIRQAIPIGISGSSVQKHIYVGNDTWGSFLSSHEAMT